MRDRPGGPIPIECKWFEAPTIAGARHLAVFMREHPSATRGYVVCRTPRRYQLTAGVEALPWRELPRVLRKRSGDTPAHLATRD